MKKISTLFAKKKSFELRDWMGYSDWSGLKDACGFDAL
jgi:hypothetical protein